MCAAQARPTRSFGHQKQWVVRSRLLPPSRRRETIFREPRWWRFTSSLHPRRRPRMAGTPASVSDAERGHCRSGFSGRGKSRVVFGL